MSVSVFFKIVWAAIMSIFTAIGGIFGAVPAGDDVCMIGHRGYSGKYPENTELAFFQAAKNNFGGAETDIRLTKDGVYVTSHNSTVVFEDGSEMGIEDHTYAELTAKPLKNKKTKDTVYLCTYKRYLEIMKEYDMICFIELKSGSSDGYTDEQVKEIFDIAEETYDLSKCILQSFDFNVLLQARKLFPELPLMLTYGADDTGYERCFDYGISIDADFSVITEEMVKEFHDRGLVVGAWTCNLHAVISYCKSLGVDYIESDNYGK